jgi:hypothetical protein
MNTRPAITNACAWLRVAQSPRSTKRISTRSFKLGSNRPTLDEVGPLGTVYHVRLEVQDPVDFSVSAGQMEAT